MVKLIIIWMIVNMMEAMARVVATLVMGSSQPVWHK